MDLAPLNPASAPPESSAPPRRRSAWRKFRRRAGAAVGRALGPLLVKLLAKTWRVRFLGAEIRDARDAQGRLAVFAFWHQNILAAVGTHFGYPVQVLVSLHRDGETIAQLADRLGYATVRGSTHGGGSSALREMIRVAAAHPDAFAFTPDGPRGPARSIAPGVIHLAAAVQRPLVASGFAASRFWQARSWDRMLLPKPFARIVVAYGAACRPPESAARQGPEHDAARAALAAAMDAAEARAHAALVAWIGKPVPEAARA